MNDQVLDRAVREVRGRIVAALAAQFRDFDIAEEAFAAATLGAIEAWRAQGEPRDPAAWLYAAARRRALDLTRRAKVRRVHPREPLEPAPSVEDIVLAGFEPIPDERLRLIFTCCHPALEVEARIALTLRVICGLSVERLARAFLVSQSAMTQRLTRAKRKIAMAKIPFVVPGPEAWAERLVAVLAALEIAYAQAYEDASGLGDASGLADESLRLSGILCDLMPQEPEVLGFAAMVRLAEARRGARLDPVGQTVPLAQQDVGLWNKVMLDQGFDLLARAAALGCSGPYQIMAAIHAAHASRAETGETPWTAVLILYDALIEIRPSPVVVINRAIALAQVAGPVPALEALEALNTDVRVEVFAPYHVALAHLATAADRTDDARTALIRAINLITSPAEQQHLRRNLQALEA